MALKALDQRIASTSSPAGSHSTNASPPQAPRPPPPAAAPRNDPAMPSSPPAVERKKSDGEVDIGDIGKAKVDIR